MSEPIANQSATILPEQILVNLREYKRHTTCTCLGCGYSGVMGIKRLVTPWYASWLIIIPICLFVSFLFWIYVSFLAAVIFGSVLGVVRTLSMKKELSCPNCRLDLVV